MSRCRVHRVRETLLTTGALLGSFSILAALAATVLGVTPLVFRSGSMSPAIETGDLGVARSVPVVDLHPGDIVSVVDSRGVRITHRLVSIERTGNSASLVLKGDANDAVDAQPYVVTHADRMLFAIPRAGYVVAWLSGPVGVFLGGLLVGLVLLVLFRRPGDADREEGQSREAVARGVGRDVARASVVLTVAAVVTVSGVLLPGRATGTLAAWSDDVGVTGASLGTGLAAPVASCGPLDRKSTTIIWSAVPGATAYVLHDGLNASNTTTVSSSQTSITYTTPIAVGTFHVEAQFANGTVTWTSASSNSLTYRVLGGIGECS